MFAGSKHRYLLCMKCDRKDHDYPLSRIFMYIYWFFARSNVLGGMLNFNLLAFSLSRKYFKIAVSQNTGLTFMSK